jgi:hypothetical protein
VEELVAAIAADVDRTVELVHADALT